MRSRNLLILIIFILVLVGFIYLWLNQDELFKKEKNFMSEKMVNLSEPKKSSAVSLEEAIDSRQSVREYSNKKISLEELSQILWAANGINKRGKRTAPSAGALYPIELYVVGGFGNYESGIYHYLVQEHSLERIKKGEFLAELSEIGLGQKWIKEAPLAIIVSGVIGRTKEKYGARAEQYVALEAGHVGQNIYLQSTALNLGTVSVGAFNEERISEFLGFEEDQKAYYIFPVGHKL